MSSHRFDPPIQTGDATIDAQHRSLVELFDRLVEAEIQGHGEERIFPALEHLTDYVLVHFAEEISLMERCGYPAEEAEAHKAEHRTLTDHTRELVLDYRSGALESVGPLVEFLYTWLVEHVGRADVKLTEYARSSS